MLKIRIIHDSMNVWHVLSGYGNNGELLEEGSAKDTSFKTTNWFGFYCRYTSSNSMKFYFDDVYIGEIKTDTIPPEITRVEVISNDHLLISFSENIERVRAETPTNYLVRGLGYPSQVNLDSLIHNQVHLYFNEPLQNASCDTLEVRNIVDLKGNVIRKGDFIFCIYKVKAYDIVIDEIMADPTPQVGLPDAEYIELFNRTGFPINLKDWTLEFGSYKKKSIFAVLN